MSVFSAMESDRKMSFPIAEFMDYFLESEDMLTKQHDYEFLTLTLQTMKNVDPSYLNRIGFDAFFDIVNIFFDEEEAQEVFKEVDTDGVKMLHVANMFDFFKNYVSLDAD